MRDRWRRAFVLPNYTPARWWECDLFELTDGGFFREYEVKLSRGDFFADAKKAAPIYPRPYGMPERVENKHALLSGRDTRCPSQFWFVTPAELIKPAEVPEWAGLIEIRDSGGRLYEKEAVKAPRLHRLKFPANAAHARTVCYWRMHAEFGTAEPIRWIDEPAAVEDGAGI